ncbi:uncharacterized protein N7506_012087 [Penicillium brevicompactum]|uniref:uncharacterized protein n=1 Tax=Penicillium brevicompactum TaxID=5074 RepID=UPI002541CBE0|nr:uncharacterized protein N7506_012087 [Penicillium brevicompactum]KAJ5319383.1 hypothetical protein N7506_012087 [Penicillium brevicompactum]
MFPRVTPEVIYGTIQTMVYRTAYLSSNWQDGRVGLRRTVQVNLIPMVHNCLRVSKGAWVQIPLLSSLFASLCFGIRPACLLLTWLGM